MLPQEFLKRMENMLGEEYPAFLKSYDIARYLCFPFGVL